jgi:hypothetical protein
VLDPSLSGRDLAEVFNLAQIDRSKRLNNLMRELLPGDTVVLDQARPPGAIKPGPAQILHTLQGLRLRLARESWRDTRTEVGGLVMTIMDGIAEFERRLIHKRCEEWIERASRKGTKFGSPTAVDASQEKIAGCYAAARRWPNSEPSTNAARRRFGARVNNLRSGDR